MRKKNAGYFQLCGLSGVFERKQLVAVVFVLLFAGFDFGGDALRQVVYECVEFVQNGDDAFLFGKRGNGEHDIV